MTSKDVSCILPNFPLVAGKETRKIEINIDIFQDIHALNFINLNTLKCSSNVTSWDRSKSVVIAESQ